MCKFIETESRTAVTRGWKRGPGELLFSGYRVFLVDDEKVLGIDSGDDYTTFVNVFNVSESYTDGCLK